MKRARILLCTVLAVMAAVPAFGHSPQDMSITVTGEDVDVVVFHPVGDPLTHYIKSIEVRVNDVPATTLDFTQQTGNTQKARFTIPGLKKEDTVTVQAVCSRFGSLVRTQRAE